MLFSLQGVRARAHRSAPAEVFHEALEHRWFLSQEEGEDVGLMPAVKAYVDDVLRHAPDERAVLEPGAEAEDEAEETTLL